MSLEQQIADDSAQTATARAAGVARAVPPATEPLKATQINALARATSTAMAALSAGQLDPFEFEKVTGDVGAVPPDIGAAAVAMMQFAANSVATIPELEPYVLDSPKAMLESNAGIDELQVTLDAMGRDQKLITAMEGVLTEPVMEGEEQDPQQQQVQEQGDVGDEPGSSEPVDLGGIG